MKTNLILVNNDIIDPEELNVHPFNRGHQFGDGIYEIISVYNGKAVNAEMHMENLFNAMVQIKIPGFYMVEEMVAQALETIIRHVENNELCMTGDEKPAVGHHGHSQGHVRRQQPAVHVVMLERQRVGCQARPFTI